MGITERKDKDKQWMRTRILETAMKLFLKAGFERVTIRAIAREIEYSPATIYLYFKDKNEILYALQEIGFDKLYEAQQTVLSVKDPLKRLREQGKVYVSFALDNPEFYDLMFIMRGPVKKMKEKKKWETNLRSYGLLRDTVQACIETGALKRTNSDAATFAFWSLTHGIASLIIRERCIMFPQEHLRSIIKGAMDFVMDNIAHHER
jgi:AcrR family transcriptional regulator